MTESSQAWTHAEARKTDKATQLAFAGASVFFFIEILFMYSPLYPVAHAFVRGFAEWLLLPFGVFAAATFMWLTFIVVSRLPKLLTSETIWSQLDKVSQISFAVIATFITYLASNCVYAIYLWQYASCIPTSDIWGVGVSFECDVRTTYHTWMTQSLSQLVRGLFGDFAELIDGREPLDALRKDPLFITVTAFYRAFAQAGFVALLIVLWRAVRLAFSARRVPSTPR